MSLSRKLNETYAYLNHYFWLPCPYPDCGRMFGGHEIGEYTMQYPDYPAMGKACCKLHDEDVPYKVFLRTGEIPENLKLSKNYFPELTFEI